MYRSSLPLALILALTTMAISARAAAKPDPAQGQQGKRVWTNEDLDELRARGLISIVGPAAEAPPAPPVQATPYSSRTQDPAWYADQAADLQAQLNDRIAALLRAQEGLAQARSLRQTTGGINLAQGNVGITPESGIAILEAQLREVQSRFDEVADLARRNDIPPGILRG